MQQACNNFIADPNDTSFGFQIKCKNCQFTRKQHIQNNNVKPNPQPNIGTTNTKQQDKLVNLVENVVQNPKSQVGMYGSLNQQNDISTIKSNEQNDFKKTTSLNSKQDEKDESDLLTNNQLKFERQNLQIYNSEKGNPQNQEQLNKVNQQIKEQNSQGLPQNPSVQQDLNSPQKVEQIQNINEIKQNEPQEQKPNIIQSNPFIQQNKNSPQKLEQKSNITQPFQIKPQVQLIKDQQDQQQTINQSQNQPQTQIEQNIKPQIQIEQNKKPQIEQTINPQIKNEQTIKPQGNLLIPQANQNTNQSVQSVKERAKGMQIFGFGAPPPIKISQKSDQEKPLESYLIDRPIVQNKKHHRTQQDFQNVQK
ncbi:unnamed protein product [Paramecium primaurelia]|uniref:Uncharacterized protein n=1 Tax=Paramecium primaurelia TaxID=5886 RepID=A0A8S1K7K5_PARPR|nr:unnamed protein product [Paramecium primaurelia]